MAGNDGGPWGGGKKGGGGGGDDRDRGNDGGRRPGQSGSQIPEIDEIMKKGQEQLRVLMGGRGGSGGGGNTGGGGGPRMTRGTFGLAALGALALWAFASFYSVKPEEQSVELFLGKYYKTGSPGLNFAPWPLVTKQIEPVTRERTVDVGQGTGRSSSGLMLTRDENIVDIDFQVVWNINDLQKYLFSLRDPQQIVTAISESAMREIIAQSDLAPILNRDRGIIASSVQELIQKTLDENGSGINVVRVNFDKADPPREVIDSFRAVQAAEQERDRLLKQADAYANRVLAGARGKAAQIIEEAEGYRARVVNEAEGEASRFSAVLNEYQKAPDVTRKRLYLETMEKVLGDIDKIILDDNGPGAQGVVPFLPLNELLKKTPTNSRPAASTSSAGGN